MKLVCQAGGDKVVVGQQTVNRRAIQQDQPGDLGLTRAGPEQSRRSSRVNQGPVAFPDEEDFHPGDGQHLPEFVGLGAKVQGDKYGVQLGGGEVDFHNLVGVDLHDGDAVAGLDSLLGQGIRQAVGPFL